MTSTRLLGERSARAASDGFSDGSGSAAAGVASTEGSSAREPVSATGRAAAIASRAMPTIQRIRKTMFGAEKGI